MESIIIVIVLILLVVFAVVLAHKAREKRRAELSAWATAKGLSFSPDTNHHLDEEFPFAALRTGSNRYGYNIMRGKVGVNTVCAFDYHYETESRDSKGNRQTHSHVFSAVVLETPHALRDLSIRPEGFFDRVAEFLGFDDIDFEMDEFNRKFHVKSDDRRWAFDVLHQETMEYLLGARKLSMEMKGRAIIASDAGHWKPEQFDTGLDVPARLIAMIPKAVLDEPKELK